ncbi:hypothetical protein ABPG75_009054 [Micractinium tetrahymenae]
MGRGRGGRGGGRGGKRGHSGDGSGGHADKRQRTDAWRKPEDIPSNGGFEEYYKEQGVCPPEEWDAFLLCLKKQLPITFRINGQGKFADRLVAQMESNFLKQFTEEPVVLDGEEVEKPHPLAWYPGKLAWQMNFSRSQLRKLDVLEQLHEFIKRENEIGSITRQEAVSMVPPLFMDVQPHHRVLDMCAAPGSKTFQLLEMLHAGPAPATGLVVANDADVMRCNLLTHQTKRMCSPNLVVTNHEAQNFPLLRNLLAGQEGGAAEKIVLFDRILCDVPCSGDGTMRKAPDIWRRWNVSSGNGLHSLQLRIALRACELLRVGGRLVYSTCTFNPVEDEAVVAEVLRRTKGAFELVDVSGSLPGLRRMPGMQRWKVRDRDRWYTNWEEGKEGFKLDPTMFPDEQSDAMPLHLCMRFLPHHQDTGGFFVAVLRKVRELDGPIEPVRLDHRSTRGKEAKEARQAAAAPAAGAAEGEAGAAGEAAVAVKEEAAAVKEEPEVKQEEGAAAVKEEPEVKQEEDAAAVKEEAKEEAMEVAATVKQEEGAAEQQPAGAAAAAAQQGSAEGEAAGDKPRGWKQRQREAEEEEAVPEGLPEWGARSVGGGKRNRQGGGGRWRGVDPILPYVEPEVLSSLRSFYGLAPDCPVPAALVARSADARPKKLHYCGPAVKQLLQMDYREQLKVIGAGVKVLERQDSKDGLVACVYRLAQDGLPAALPFVTKQRFEPTVDELLLILQQRQVGLPQDQWLHMTKGQAAEGAAASGAAEAKPVAAEPGAGAAEEAQQAAAPPAAEGQQQQAGEAGEGAAEGQQATAGQDKAAQAPRSNLQDAATLEQLRSVGMGCCVAAMRHADAVALGFAGEAEGDAGAEGGSGLAAAAPIAISCWRGRNSINVLVSKQEAAQIAEKILEARAKAPAAS